MDRGSLDLVHGFKGIAGLARARKSRLCEHMPSTHVIVFTVVAD